MSLLTRLVAPAPGEIKLPVHQFMAAVAENRRGVAQVTIAAIAAAFNLSGAEQTSLTNFLNQAGWNGTPPTLYREMVHDVLLLGETGIYSVAQCQARLGLT